MSHHKFVNNFLSLKNTYFRGRFSQDSLL